MGVSKLSAKQPWTTVWTPGVNLVNFFNLYDSKGDVTISTATSIPTTLDGPIQVVRYGALTVNAALTASQRCRGLMPLCDSLTMGAAGSISMTARGAAGASKWAVGKDIIVPQSITFSGKNTSYADFLKWIRTTGYCIFDPSLYACPPAGMGDVTCDWATWTPYGGTIVSASGCGTRGLAMLAANNTGLVGAAGGAGTNAPGGGGGGGAYNSISGQGGKGRPWGGGAGGGASCNPGIAAFDGIFLADDYGGPGGQAIGSSSGGGAGNPGGDGSVAGSYAGSTGTGGILIEICRGNVTIASGGTSTSNGSAGGVGANGYASGGSSGGGVVAHFYLGTLTGIFAGTANGGPAAGSGWNGGAGGAGTVVSKTFAAMGWS